MFFSSRGLQHAKKGHSTEAYCRFEKNFQHELEYLLLNSQVGAKQGSYLISNCLKFS